ncbi:FkbM family methyltransferase [Rhodoblastus acidophilus]|uniref:FkbM family methyltransferase n=1 Tax=Rhodoblastus acidophilus TaxID=1074 RepID=UPI00222540D1
MGFLLEITREESHRSSQLGIPYRIGTRRTRSNVGQTAWGLTKYFKLSPIYSFEPVSQSFAMLEDRYGQRVKCFRLAFGCERAELAIQLHADSELNSFKPTRESARQTGQEIVKVRTLDDFCTEHDIREIAVLKMDVQGWEDRVLEGARDLIGRRAIRFIFAEVGFRSRDTDMQDFAALNAMMDSLGFEFCGLYEPFRWGPAKLYCGFANALYALPA